MSSKLAEQIDSALTFSVDGNEWRMQIDATLAPIREAYETALRYLPTGFPHEDVMKIRAARALLETKESTHAE